MTSASPTNILPKNKKYTWIVLTVLISIAVIALAFFAGTFVHSKNEEAVANSKYTPEITAKVETRSFPAEFVEAKGKVSLGGTQTVVVSAIEGGQAVVTSVKKNVGDVISSGSLLAYVSGRPVIALDLPFDLYRDITDGAEGADVKEIQRALARLGLYKGKITGIYNDSTANAVKALYKRVGASLPQTANAASSAPAPTQSESANSTPQQNSTEAPTPTLTKNPLPTIRSAEFLSLTSGPATVIQIAGVNQHITSENPLAKLRMGTPSTVARVGIADAESFAV